MLKKPTVLVLGAGSSDEFKLPVGNQLAQDIADRTNFYFADGFSMTSGDRELYDTMKTRYPTHSQVLSVGRAISQGLPLSRSIDDFLYNQGEDECLVHVGKAAIVRSILTAEKNSALIGLTNYDDDARRSVLRSLSDSWIYRLFTFLQTDVRKAHVESIFHNLTIINFNYDRCVELFLFHALQQAYSLDEAAAAKVMKDLVISHPYGQPGPLPWQSPDNAVVFGAQLRMDRLLAATELIKTYTEQAHDEQDRLGWQASIAQCDQLIFLGFAFHRQNVEILKSQEQRRELPAVLSTAYKVSPSDMEVFEGRVNSMLGPPRRTPPSTRLRTIEFVDGKCAELIKQHGLAIAG